MRHDEATTDSAEPRSGQTAGQAAGQTAGQAGAVFDAVAAPDAAAHAETLAHAGTPALSTPAHPRGQPAATRGSRPYSSGLGQMAEIGAWIAACQGRFPPRRISNPRMLVVAADHGIAERNVSAYGAGATAEMLDALDTGSAAPAVLAGIAGAGLRVIDIGVDAESRAYAGRDRFKVCRSSRPIDIADALSGDDVHAALRSGIELADAEVDAGTDLLIATSIGVASTTPAAAIVAAVTGAEAVAVTGRGSGIDDQAWMRKAAAVRDALRRGRSSAADPWALLRIVGGADLAALAGMLAQAAVRRTPVLIDGFTASAAALIAEQLAPGARRWWRAAQLEPEPGHARALEHIEVEPLLDLDMRTGAGPAALPLLIMASAAAEC